MLQFVYWYNTTSRPVLQRQSSQIARHYGKFRGPPNMPVSSPSEQASHANGVPAPARHDKLRPYEFHGVYLEPTAGGREALGDCPFCDKESKFSVNTETGLW